MPNTKLKPGQTMSLQVKMELLFELREMMESGYASVSKICEVFNVSRKTAVELRKQAMELIARDSNGYTREAIRSMQIGRIQHQIERLHVMLDELEAKGDKKLALQVHDRISNYYEKLHRISGLNTEVNVGIGQLPQQMVIIKTRDQTASAWPLELAPIFSS